MPAPEKEKDGLRVTPENCKFIYKKYRNTVRKDKTMGKHLKDCMIYAVDFDGTLCIDAFPGIGRANTALIEWLKARRASGDKLILWTNRVGSRLAEAVSWCGEKGLFFDAVNENLPEIKDLYAPYLEGLSPGPKITADVFLDDHACGIGLPFGQPVCPLKKAGPGIPLRCLCERGV